MLRSVLAAAVLLAFAATSSIARTPTHADMWNGAEIDWRDPRSGIYEASKTGRPVLMLFHATWCGVCRRFQAVFRHPEIVQAARDFVMILVDVDTEKEVNGAFSPDGTYVPRTLFIDSEGNVSDQLVGKDAKYPHTLEVDTPDELIALMRKARDVFRFPPPEAPQAGGGGRI